MLRRFAGQGSDTPENTPGPGRRPRQDELPNPASPEQRQMQRRQRSLGNRPAATFRLSAAASWKPPWLRFWTRAARAGSFAPHAPPTNPILSARCNSILTVKGCYLPMPRGVRSRMASSGLAMPASVSSGSPWRIPATMASRRSSGVRRGGQSSTTSGSRPSRT